MPIGLKGNNDGSGAIQIGGSDAITISTGLNTTFAGTVTSPTGTLYPLVSGTAVASTSGTAIDFTSIPSWVKRITVMLNGVSTNGSSNVIIQIGSGSVTTTGYLGSATVLTSIAASTSFTTGFGVVTSNAAASVFGGICSITTLGNNIWTMNGSVGFSNAAGTVISGAYVTLAGTLDRVRITTVNGTDTFDAGSINILYE